MGKIHNAKRREWPNSPDKGANAITSKERRKFLHPPEFPNTRGVSYPQPHSAHRKFPRSS